MDDTDQEIFWKGEFGNEYIERNKSEYLLAANLHFFARITQNIGKIESIFEFGCNAGMNLKALSFLMPDTQLAAVEINERAASQARKIENVTKVHNDSIQELQLQDKYDFVFSKGVLIHLNPDQLPKAYQKLANSSNRYVMIAEYFNPAPVMLSYRGNDDKLYKRDFAAEFIGQNQEFKLIDYGFCYKNVSNYSQDDITWFLMERKNA